MSAEVSIVIPTLNSPVIGRVLDAVRAQTADLSRTEVIVVGRDDLGLVRALGRGEIAAPPAAARNDAAQGAGPVVRFLESEGPLPPAQARNRGLAASQGEIVIFLDADCVPEPDWLERLLARFRDAEVCVVGGSMAPAGEGFWRLADNLSTFHEYLSTSPAGTRELLPTFSLGCRRAALEVTGGFDEAYPFPAGEDADLALRLRMAGYGLHFEPRAQVRHYPGRSGLGAILRHAYRFGQYSVKVDRRYAGLGGAGPSWPLRSAWRVLVAAPLLAGSVTARAFGRNRSLWRYWAVAPVMFAAKLAWCAGAARTLRRGAPTRAPWGSVYRLPSRQHPSGPDCRAACGGSQ